MRQRLISTQKNFKMYNLKNKILLLFLATFRLKMPRVYKRKSAKGSFSPDDMKKALELVNEGKSIREAAKRYKLSHATLHRYYTKQQAGTLFRHSPNYSWRRVFSDEQEKALENYIIICSKMFYGLSLIECRRLAYEMAIKNNIVVDDAWHQSKMAGKEWMSNFRRRRGNLSLRTPEACSLARAASFNKTNVKSFFRNLEDVLGRSNNFADGTRMYNLDETATTTVQNPQKVLAEKGLKSVCQVTSGEKGVLVTTCAIISASGQYLPPIMIFPRVHFKSHMTKGAPAGTLGLANQSGWMTAQLFLEVLKHFVKHTCSSRDNPTLLIYDNHESHLSLAVLDFAKENGITILTFPPHSTNKMQPLDVGVFGPFKRAYNYAVDSWMICNPGKTFSIYDVAHCVGIAFGKAMTPTNIIAAFKKTGIFPLDKEIFSEVDFLPSLVTSPEEELSGRIGNYNVENVTIQESSNPNPDVRSIGRIDPIPSTSRDVTSIKRTDPTPSISREVTSVEKTDPTPSSFNTFKSPEAFRGYPKAGARKGVRKGRKKGRSIIATDTPEKNEIAGRRCNAPKGQKSRVAKRKGFSESSGGEEPMESYRMHNSDDDCESEDFVELECEMLDNSNRTPQESDYVLVKFQGKGSDVFYIGKAIGDIDNSNCIDVSFLRKSGDAFIIPNVPDIAQVPASDIRSVLPPPVVLGMTRRQQSRYKFPVSFSSLNVR